ncbi:MAG: PAS domain-containing protein [Beijerinckiaceae bacterium]
MIHDAIAHLITPVDSLPKAMPVIQQAARALIEQQLLLKKVLGLPEGAIPERLGAPKPEEAFSLPHSVLKRDLHFASVSKSYCLLFEFSPADFQRMSFNELLHPADGPRFSRTIELLLKGQVESCEAVYWRVTGSHRFVLTKDTMWGIATSPARGPQYIATVSERIADQDDAARLVARAKLRIPGPAGSQKPK